MWLGLCLAKNACVRFGECGPPWISALGGRGTETLLLLPLLFFFFFFYTQRKSLVLSSMKMGMFVGHLSSGCCKDREREAWAHSAGLWLLLGLGADRARTADHRHFGASDLP